MEKTITKNQDLSWKKVEDYLDEKTKAGNLMAIVETEKLFMAVVKSFDFLGQDIERQIESLGFVFSDYDALKKARILYKKIVKKENFDASRDEIDRNLAVYYQAIKDLLDFKKKKISFFRKLKLAIKSFIPSPKHFLKNFILFFLIFFLVIFLLDSTDFGRAIANFFVNISHLIFSWALFVILLIAGIAILVIGTIYYFQRRSK